MGCKVLYNIDLVCGDTLFPGGVDGKLWIGYTSDLSTKFDTASSSPTTTVLFSAYKGLKILEGIKYAHLISTDGQVGAGGNVSLMHRATMKFITNSTQDDAQILRLMQATDAFIFYKDGRNEFKILGPSGMRYAAGALFSQGQGPSDDVSDTIILEGTEICKPLRFAPTGVTDIAAYLDARVV